MAVVVFLVYFYTALDIEKKTKFSTKSPRKYAILTQNLKKAHPHWCLWCLDSARAFGALLCPPPNFSSWIRLCHQSSYLKSREQSILSKSK